MTFWWRIFLISIFDMSLPSEVEEGGYDIYNNILVSNEIM